MSKRGARVAVVIDLADARARRRLARYGEKVNRVLEANRQAIGRLYTSGALFSHQGAKAGRDLLRAHQHMLRVVSLLDRLMDGGEVPAPRRHEEICAVYEELDALLDRTSLLTTRTGSYLARLRGE